MNMKRAMLILALVAIAATAIILLTNDMRCTPPCI
jgi:hypothetical protein